MLEVEMKIRVRDEQALRQKLKELGALQIAHLHHIDKYFDTQPPRESFAKTDEALRLRMSEETILSDTPSSKTNIDLTYKGPKEPGIIKTRREIICMVQNEKSMEEILTAVGFVMRCQVEKHRDVFSLQYQDKHIEILIDHIEKLPGAFMEAEIMVSDAKDEYNLSQNQNQSLKQDENQKINEKQVATNILLDLLQELGFSEKDSIRQSYLELVLEKMEIKS
ncbi:MAG: class IV adenylate cyclase [Candidatus Lokiarchaeota archaeon]|nr:class IV adenylate cyclase [Candidatus Harpocratesius repetitus]